MVYLNRQGGFGKLDPSDVEGSLSFLDGLFPEEVNRAECRVLDVGAGIGRITKNCFIPAGFGEVDLLEMSARFLDTARVRVSPPVAPSEYRNHGGAILMTPATPLRLLLGRTSSKRRTALP